MPNFFKNLSKPKTVVSIAIVAIVILALFIGLWPIVIIPTGEVGIVSRLGKAVDVKDPGLNFKIPFIDSIKTIEVREQNIEKNYIVSSKDMQTITMTLNVQYSVGNDVLELYKKFGTSYKERLIFPRISESLNAVSARYTIEEFITRRNEMSSELLNELTEDFTEYGVVVSACSIIEHDFSDEFDQAIERKLVASQNALTAKNDLEKVRFEAEAEVVKAQQYAEAEIAKARGEAEANRLRQQSLTPLLVQQQAIQRWNGTLPSVMGGNSVPFINLKTQ